MESALYRGSVTHERLAPVKNRFEKRLYMLYLDLDEIDEVLGELPGLRLDAPGPLSIRRRDYLGAQGADLGPRVRDEIEAGLGLRPEGPLRLLTMPRSLGLGFNPVSFFYAFSAEGRLDAVLSEVRNTPWNERHVYAVRGEGGSLVPKRFHVSPFMGMEQDYRFRFGTPGPRLGASIENHEGGALRFRASLALERRTLSRAELTRAFLRHPCPALETLAAIYLHAALLYTKRAPFHPHPGAIHRLEPS